MAEILKRKKAIEVALGLPAFITLLVVVAAFIVSDTFSPPPARLNDRVFFNIVLVALVFVVCMPMVVFNWPLHPRCSISSRSENYRDMFGRVRVREAECGRPSIGKIKVVAWNRGVARFRYFCRRCNPEGQPFQVILRQRYPEVFYDSTVFFRFVEAEKEDDHDDHGEDDLDLDIRNL